MTNGMVRWFKIGRKEYILEVDFERKIAAILWMDKKSVTHYIWRSDRDG